MKENLNDKDSDAHLDHGSGSLMKKISTLLLNADFILIPISFCLGVLFGALVEGNPNLSPIYRPISSVIGWTYFFNWAISFYPQLHQNYIRRTSSGFVSDKIVYDMIGFSCLTIYSTCFYFNSYTRQAYYEQNQHEPLVQINDIFFACHALFITIITSIQMAYFDGYKQFPSSFCCILTSVFIGIIVLYLILVIFNHQNHSGFFSYLQWLYFLSIIKIMITIMKYIPQVYFNYKRQSTIGWSVGNSILDLSGGLLSQIQLIFDCYDTNNWNGIIGNFVKFALGFISVLFDLIFIVQHFILYTNSNHCSDSANDLNQRYFHVNVMDGHHDIDTKNALHDEGLPRTESVITQRNSATDDYSIVSKLNQRRNETFLSGLVMMNMSETKDEPFTMESSLPCRQLLFVRKNDRSYAKLNAYLCRESEATVSN
jgi:cystinosin